MSESGLIILVGALPNVTIHDDCQDYGEPRWITVGRLDEREVEKYAPSLE